MASRGNPADARQPAPRLYLMTPQVADPAGAGDAMAAALAGADVAAVLLRLAAADERSQINCAKALAPVVQDRGAALLLDGCPDIVARSGADGAHLTGVDAFQGALATLKPARIAGCGGLTTRHDAMVAAESGADYVMFGEPDERRHPPSVDALVERVAWGAGGFEGPCVGYARGVGERAP